MSVVPPAGTHSYCTEGEYLLATPVPLYVIALARLVLHYTSHTFFLNKMFTKSATVLRHNNVARFLLCCSSSPQHVFLYVAPETRNIVPSPIPQGLTRRVTLSLLKCPSRGLTSTNVKGNASTTAVHWMARMARAEALREGSAVPLLSLPQVSTESPAFASFHIGNPRFGLGFPVLLVSCSFPMLLPSILQVHGHKGWLTPFHGIEDRSI